MKELKFQKDFNQLAHIQVKEKRMVRNLKTIPLHKNGGIE